MDDKKEAFDVRGFLNLLAEVAHHDVTGVVNVRIHVRGGMPWAVSFQFDDEARAA